MSLNPNSFPSDIMASIADGSMRAHVDVDAFRLMGLDAEVALKLWDPQACPTPWLPVCAFNYSVTLYEDIWNEQTKRDWIDGNWDFIRQIGTPPAYDTALNPSGMKVHDRVLPPQGYFATETLSKAEMDEWVRLAPRIRVTYGNRVGGPDPYFFVGDYVTGEGGDGFVGPNDGPALVGRYATFEHDGIVEPMASAVETNTFTETAYQVEVSYATPGQNDFGIFVGDYYVGEDQRCFVGADQIEPTYVSATLDRSYIHQDTTYQLDFLQTGLQQQSIRYETESETGDAGLSAFVGDAFVGYVYATNNDAPYLLADVFYLYDPSIVIQTGSFGSFVGDRIGMPLRTMELMVDLGMKATAADPFAEDCFVGEIFATETDTEPFNRALRAIEAARGGSDRVLVAFDHMRPIEAQDFVGEATYTGAWVANTL